MKIALLFVFLILLFSHVLVAYDDPSGMNLKAPTSLKPRQAEFKIEHRFYGKVNDKPFDTLFGMYSGANACLSLRYSTFKNLEMNCSYERDNKESAIGISYAYFYPNAMFRSQIDAQLFSYKEFNLQSLEEERKSNAFAFLSLQLDPIMKRFMPSINIGYDGDKKEIGAGIGLYAIVFQRLGIIRKIIIIGEYFPTKIDKRQNCYDFGIRLETYGHNFDFIFGNGSEIGTRRSMFGTDKPKGLYFGFNIKRLIDS